MREPLQESRDDTYERPNQPWLCGLADTTGPCPFGPGAGGRCPTATACQPVREGDRWRCNRAPGRGGPCHEGPTPEGQCAHVYHCTPIMSLRLKRGRFVLGCMLVGLGLLAVMFSADWRNEALSPGSLSAHHAQTLEGVAATDRCATCHAAGPQTFAEWLRHVTDAGLARPSQTELCLKCHHNRIAPDAAIWAHNIDPTLLLAAHADKPEVSPSDRPRDPTQPIACSACHREHHGLTHNLVAMSDSACQACHRERFHSFAKEHPEFTSWPAARRTRIAFDHATHEAKHFPRENREFLCASCHQPSDDGSLQRTLPYEATCAACHDAALAASWEAGVPVFSLPMLDIEALTKAGQNVGQWPDEASGEFDGALPPITKLLIASDERAAAALKTLGPSFDFFDVSPADTPQLAAVADVVWATKELIYDVTSGGHAAMRTRIESLLGRPVTALELNGLTAHLSPENLAPVTQLWLTQLAEEVVRRRGGDAPPATGGTPATAAQMDRAAARDRVVGGGWFRDDVTLAIRYRPSGHADRFVTAWTNLLVELANGPHGDLARPLLKHQLAPTAPGLCGSCHSLDRSDDGKLTVNWLSKQSVEPGFTVFSHAPHLTQVQLADCKACHTIDATANVAATFQNEAPHDFVDGFLPLTRESCATCHTAQAAGESCTLCHRYHAVVGDDTARSEGIP